MWQNLQRAGFLHVNAFARHTPALHAPMSFYARYGVVLFAALLVLGWWSARRDRDPRAMAAAIWAPAGALLALGLNQPLGNLVHEARPYAVLPHVLVLVSHSHDFSFPSDHAVMAGAVATGVLLTHRRLGWFTIAAAALLAFARVYVGAHFPLDVIVGLLVGAAVSLIGYATLRHLLVRIVTALSRTAARPIVASCPIATGHGKPA